MMTTPDGKDVAQRYPPVSIPNAKQGNVISQSSASLQVDSATVYLLKKATSSLWGMMQNCGWDGYPVGIAGGMNAKALAEVNSMFSSKVVLYLHSAVETVQSMNDIGVIYSNDACDEDDDAPPITSDISDSSSCEQNSDCNQGGLMFQSADFNTDQSDDRFDYIITQVDISRMARTSSRHLNIESIQQLPTITYNAKDQLICSTHEEEDEEVIEDENVDEFLLRNAQIIEDYFDSPEDNIEVKCKREDINSGFSWMMVPNDPSEEDMTRMSNSIHSREIPDSISICKSSDSVSLECNADEAFEHCAVCQEPFQDGECLRVLPCQHLFHTGCIDKWLSRENSSDECVGSSCSMCKKAQLEGHSQEEVSEHCTHQSQVESDDVVPSWAFARMGTWS